MAQLQKVIRPILKANRYFGSGMNLSDNGKTEYTVEQLSIAANLSVRTIRNYQDKDLLEAPTLKGRKGFYSNKHLARLKLISNLIHRGFSVNAIREMLDALEEGVGLDEFLGVESALTSPWSDEKPQIISLAELYKMFSGSMTPEALKKAQELKLFRIKSTRVHVDSMQLLVVGKKLTSNDIPLMELLDTFERMQLNVQEVATDFIRLVSAHALEPYGQKDLPPKEEFPNLASLVWDLRPLAEKAIKAELGRAMGEAANTFLANKLADVLATQSIVEENHKNIST